MEINTIIAEILIILSVTAGLIVLMFTITALAIFLVEIFKPKKGKTMWIINGNVWYSKEEYTELKEECESLKQNYTACEKEYNALVKRYHELQGILNAK